MGLPAYIAGNLIDEGTGITSDGVDSVYGVENIYQNPMALVTRFDDGSGGWLEFDLGSAQTFDSVAILGHNVQSSGTFVIKSGNSPNPSTVTKTPAWRARHVWTDMGSVTHQYVRVTITDANPTLTQVGMIRIYTRVVLPWARRLGWSPAINERLIADKTYMGVDKMYKLWDRETRNLSFRVPTDDLADLRTLHEAVRGFTPFVLIPEQDLPEVFYGRKEPDFVPQELPDQVAYQGQDTELYDYTLQFTEVSFGVDVEA